MSKLLLTISALLFASPCLGQSWSGILSASRAIDWKNAGLPATFTDGETTANPWTPPTRSACTSAQAGITVPVAAGTSFSSIVTAMAACSAANTTGSYLLLGSGAFTISASANFASTPNVSLRGSGPMSTTLTFSGSTTLAFGQGGSKGGGLLSASPSAGATSVTLTGVSGTAPVVGQLAWFNQCDSGFSGSTNPTQGYNTCGTGSITDNGAVFVCGGSTACNSNGTGSGGGGQTSQFQYVIIKSVTNNGGGSYTIGFSNGLYLPNWSTSNTAAMYWQNGQVGTGVGLEDMTIVETGGSQLVQLGTAYASWIKGVRFIGIANNYNLLIGDQTKNSLFFNNYIFGATPSSMVANSIQIALINDSDDLILNNIAEQSLFLEGHGSASGDVIAYNWSKNVSTNYVQSTDYQHDNSNSGVSFILNEGNQVNMIDDDNTWGTGDLNTFFRNWTSCSEEPFTYSSVTGNGISIDSFHRFDNAVANVLGGGNQCTTYSGTASGDWFRVNNRSADTLTATSLMRWANWDAANAAVRCQSSEVPTSLSGNAAPFDNAVPTTPTVCGGSATIPASFFMDSIAAHPSGGTGLSWWKVCTSWTTFPTSCAATTTEPFPSAGPDVTGGNYTSGFAYDNPASLAWRKLPIDTTQQNSYTITGSSWSGGTETLTVSGLPAGTQTFGPFQISGGNCATSGAGTSTGAEVQMTNSSTTTVQYALASNPGTCTGTMKWPDVRQFDERVFQTDPASTNTTWYIRTDGGTATQCTGTTNAAYPGSGSAQACAFNHPYWMIASGGTSWAHMVGGDTIQFVDSGTSKTYYMGEQNGGLGFDWNGNGLSSICPAPNSGGGAGTSCILPAFPSGTSTQHTRILGQNVGSCHDSGHTHLVNPTILSGINTTFSILDTRGTNYVDIDCIMLTQPDTCTLVATGLSNECTGSSNITKYGGLILNFGSGNQGAANLTLQDFAVVGLSGSGILGSKVNLTSSDVLTGSDIYIIGNGGSGWNGDSGGCGTGCESVGTMNLSYMNIDWNGCQAVTPYNMTLPVTQNAFTDCYDQNTGNGLGDGFVQIAAGNLTLNVTNSFFRWNTQDGFDALHLSDDITTSPVTNVSTSWSEGNEGQTFKIGAGASSTAINNMSISNCRVLGTASNFPLNPTGWNAGVSDVCRAAGDQWSFQVKDGTSGNPVVITLENNTSVGYGTTMYDIGCAAGATCTTLFGVVQKNTLNKGYPDPGNGNVLASGWYLGGTGMSGIFSNPSSNISYNLWNTMNTGCPDSSIPSSPETNYQCGDPLLVGESNINAINPNITNGSSPALGNGVHIAAITTDYNGNAVTNPPQIGAFGQTTGGAVANPTASPVAGTYTSTQSVTLSTSTSGATICYTTDGTTPTATTPGTCSHGTTYSTAISVSTSETIMALGTLSGDTNSSVVSFAYVISPVVSTPTASPTAGTYTSTQSVVLSSGTSGAVICYTTDGTTPAATTAGTCSHGTTYSSAISVATTQTIMALGTKSGDTNSSVASFTYTINIPTVSTPTASPTAGTYTSSQSVVLSTSTSGAVICYTTDGTTPAATTAGTCSHGTTYSTAISVAATQTIMALGTKSGDTNSSVASFAYTISSARSTTFGGSIGFGTSTTH